MRNLAFKALQVTVFLAATIAPATAGPAQEECEAAQIIDGEVDAALAICGRFDIFTPSMTKMMNEVPECPFKISLSQRGHEAFRSYVYLMGADAACHAFISGIQ
jgi:hypothetical protein